MPRGVSDPRAEGALADIAAGARSAERSVLRIGTAIPTFNQRPAPIGPRRAPVSG